jgi:hypothetical protein
VHQINVRELEVLPAAAAHRHRAAAIGGERDPLAVGRPGRPEIAARPRGQRLPFSRLQIHRPQIGGPTVASGDEDQLLAVGRKRGLVVVGGTVGQALEAGSVGSDPKEIGGAFAVRCEDDRPAVGSPDRVVVNLAQTQEGMLVAAVRVGDEQTNLPGVWPDPREDDLLGIRGACGQREE